MKKYFKNIRFWLIMLLPLSGILLALAKYTQWFGEFYCRHIYQYISVVMNNMTGILPFSLGEILVLTVPLVFILYLVYWTVCTVKAKGRRFRTVLQGIINLLCAVAVTAFLYTTNCGINYYSDDVSEQMHLQTQPVSTEELYQVCVYLAQQANTAREGISENENGTAVLSDNTDARARDYVNQLLNSHYAKPKSVMLSRGMSYLDITGIYFPFTFEANVNTDVPAFSIPSTMCHELAHVNGVMHEEDANFIAFLACIQSDDKEFAYSGYTMAMIYASNELYKNDTAKYNEFTAYMGDGLIRDLAAQSAYWKQFETPVAEMASSVNDSYLKSNSQSDGINSYGKMVDLTIAYLKQCAMCN